MTEQAKPRAYLLRRLPETCPDGCGGRLIATRCRQLTCRAYDTTWIVSTYMPWPPPELAALQPQDWDGE